MLYAAIDIHKRAFQAAVLDPAGGELLERSTDVQVLVPLGRPDLRPGVSKAARVKENGLGHEQGFSAAAIMRLGYLSKRR